MEKKINLIGDERHDKLWLLHEILVRNYPLDNPCNEYDRKKAGIALGDNTTIENKLMDVAIKILYGMDEIEEKYKKLMEE